jgi:transcriptional pleiotropic repressor
MRRLNRILQQSGGEPVRFADLADVISNVLNANVYILSLRGKILGHALIEDYECDVLRRYIKGGYFPQEYNSHLLSVHDETAANQKEPEACVFEDCDCNSPNKLTTIVPIIGRGERVGTLLVARFGSELSNEDLALAEVAATILSMEIQRARAEQEEADDRERQTVEKAIEALSYSEMEAIQHIVKELNGQPEGLLVASKIADEAGITRSVIVNALRKLESAGVIESRSLGMKGTYIRVRNTKLLEELRRK